MNCSSVCIPCYISMLNKIIFAKLLIISCAQCDFFLCVLEDKTYVQFEILHNIRSFVEADDNHDDV